MQQADKTGNLASRAASQAPAVAARRPELGSSCTQSVAGARCSWGHLAATTDKAVHKLGPFLGKAVSGCV